jgi:poly-gamma-glutamate synthesis protein (capsule biosynthesis protein)
MRLTSVVVAALLAVLVWLRPVKVLVFGDLMLDRDVVTAIHEHGGFKAMLREFRKLGQFSRYDIVMANLEGNMADRRVPSDKRFAFRFDPRFAPEIQWLGVDAVSLANNHAYDMGDQGLADTKRHLARHDIAYFGDGKRAIHATVVPVRGRRVALLGFNTTFGDTQDESSMRRAVQAAKRAADVAIVMMHWGKEYKAKPTSDQTSLARALVDAGADAIVGAHSHVIGETEVYKGIPIYYSLGNFIFDQEFSRATQESLAVELTFLPGRVRARVRGLHAENSKPVWNS